MNHWNTQRVVLPLLVSGAGLGIWLLLCSFKAHDGSPLIKDYCLPRPGEVFSCFGEEFRAGRLMKDILASLYCVTTASLMAVGTGVPFGLWLGQSVKARFAFQPAINFFRCLSPLAWIPFAIFWFGIGDAGEIFLIFMASFFPIVLATLAAVSTIPEVRFRVAHDFGIHGWEMLTRVTLPSILPQLITSLRVIAGIAWVVVVAAEMGGVQNGLGFGIEDARDGLRMDIVVCYMIIIGTIGVCLDRLLAQLTRMPSVRWGYERTS